MSRDLRSTPILAWDQRYLVDMARAARGGFHIKLEVRRRFNARSLPTRTFLEVTAPAST